MFFVLRLKTLKSFFISLLLGIFFYLARFSIFLGLFRNVLITSNHKAEVEFINGMGILNRWLRGASHPLRRAGERETSTRYTFLCYLSKRSIEYRSWVDDKAQWWRSRSLKTLPNEKTHLTILPSTSRLLKSRMKPRETIIFFDHQSRVNC